MKLDVHGLNEFISVLQSKKNIVITAHQNPDGDAVGSAMGLYHALKKMGKNPVVLFPDPFPVFYSWVDSALQSTFYSKNHPVGDELLKQADIIFCLDYNEPSRTGEKMGASIRASSAYKVMIDHHPHPSDFCNLMVSFTTDCSTCQLVYRFLYTLNLQQHINQQAADALYLGIMTDTGSFRYPATSALTHRIIAELIDKGARNAAIHEIVYDNNTEWRLRLTGFALSQKLKVLPEHHTAYFVLTKQELEEYHFQSGDTEGLVNYGLSIQGIQLAAIFMEKDNEVKISFRSHGDVPANLLMSANFSGGGHKNAAGGKSFSSLDETIGTFLSIIPGFMKEHASK
ncbi:MAG: bifunctional oligoribonuclease/PAP phosphatase NrnA [Flavobacteriales bacterium]